jgi:hypothetical protein
MTEDDDSRSRGLPDRRMPPARPDPTEMLRGLRGLDLRFTAASEQLRQTIERWARIGEQVSARLAEMLDAIPRSAMAAAVEFGRRLREAFPPNWQGLEPDELGYVLDLARDGTLCLVWAPRIEVVRELLTAADQDGREMALVAARGRVLAWIHRSLVRGRRGPGSGRRGGAAAGRRRMSAP